MTACTATSGLEERRFLASRFWIKYVVMCHDPKNINLSQETNINECLLIGTRGGAGKGRATTFVNLSRYPFNTDDVRAIAVAVRERNFEAIGRATEWPADRVEAGDWSPVQWYETGLADAAEALLSASTTLTPASRLYEFGSPSRSMHDEFEPASPDTDGAPEVGMLTGIAENLRLSLRGTPDEIWRARPAGRRRRAAKPGLAQTHIQNAGWMLAAQRFSTTSSRTTSQYTAAPALGTSYVAIRTDTPEEAKTLSLLWNSTPVVIQLLSMRSKKATYPKWSVTQLQSVRVPANAREPKLVRTLAAVHDELADMGIDRLQYAADDPVRATIDDATSELFGLTSNTVGQWRTWLSQEPFMHNASPVDD